MKKIFAIFLTFLVACSMSVTVVQASVFDDLDGEWWNDELENGAFIPYASTAPAIDGEIDGVWETAPKIKSYFGQTQDFAYGYAKLLWSENTLYLLAVIFDDSVDVGEDNTANEACFWVSEESSGGDYGGGNWNISLNQAGVYEYYSGDNLETIATYTSKITADGYVVELAVPVQTNGYKYEVGAVLGFCLSVEDDVDGDNERDSVCATQSENYWSYADSLQEFTLEGLWSNPFKDVSSEDWYYEDVKYANINGLMGGTAADLFSPDVLCNRAMLVTVLWRSEGSPKVENADPFSDVLANEWYTDAVNWAAVNGIVGGYGDGKFGPSDVITHEQCVLILQRYCLYKGYDYFKTPENVSERKYSPWAEAGKTFAEANGLFDGFGSDTSDLTKKTNRAELSAYLRRFCENIK